MDEQMLRGKKIIRTSVVGIVVNILLAVTKVILGLATGSLSIMSDAVNNFSDSVSSILTIIGTALSGKKADKKHPFGYGRLEYMTSLVIAVIILVTGAETFLTSWKAVFRPEEAEYSMAAVAVIAVTVVVKIFLGSYVQSVGRKIGVDSLVAIGTEAKGDALLSLVIIVSALSSMYLNLSIDAYAGMLIAAFIMKTGLEIVAEALHKLLGEKADTAYARRIIEDVEKTEGILSAHDLIIHNYGPEVNLGTVNVELDYRTTVGDVYPVLHHLQMEILKAHRVFLVFGFYSVDETSEDTARLRRVVEGYVAKNMHCLGFHAMFVDRDAKEVFVDVVLDYTADRKRIKGELTDAIQKEFAGYAAVVTIDTEFA